MCALAAPNPPLRERFVLTDEANIRRTLELARKGRGLASPNPMVGALIVSASGRIIAEGWHEGPGKSHAEAIALAAAGEDARGATLYCSLEPCNHVGRTPPCAEAIITAGVSRVVAAARDPNPSVDGRGFRRLEEAGIEVVEGVLAWEAEVLNEAYFKHTRTGVPFVTLKEAATLDGKVAAEDESSTWVTGEEARADVHRMRGASDAIVVGAGTVLADDPRLTVRDPAYRGASVLRVAVDASGRISAAGHLFDGSAPTLVATTETAPVSRRDEWCDAGAEVLVCEPDDSGRVSLVDLMKRLGNRDVQSVLLEGGPTLAGSALREGVVDKVIIFFAPRFLGGSLGPGILGEAGRRNLEETVELRIAEVARFGSDLKVEAYVHRDH